MGLRVKCAALILVPRSLAPPLKRFLMTGFARAFFLVLLACPVLIGQWGCVPSDGDDERRCLEEVRIVVDPGHGGQDAGASPDGAPYEKEVALDVALYTERFLREEGVNVVLTRRSDQFIPLSKRAEVANEDEAALFVSIHANSCPREEVSGFEIYYAEDGHEQESRKAAAVIKRFLKEATRAEDRGVRMRNYAVLAQTKCPSLLIEVGYLSNRREARMLSSRSYRRRVGRGIARGISAYVKSQR